MKINLSIPNAEQIKQVAQLSVAVVGGIIVLKAVSAVLSKIHEKKQDKELNKLRKQVNDLDSRISSLEKAQ